MARNGLITLIAILMAFALPLRFDNQALAQVSYDDRLVPPPPGPVPPFPDWVDLGGIVTINVLDNGTFITGHSLGPFVPGRATFDRPGTVFRNIGAPFGSASQINAAGAGAIISTLSSEPAIQNGIDMSSPSWHYRITQIRVTHLPSGLYLLEYGYVLFGDSTFYLLEQDELPGALEDSDFLEWQHDDLAIGLMPPGLAPALVPPLALGETVVLGNTSFTVVNTVGEPGTQGTIPAPGLLGTIFIEGQPRQSGILTINEREPRTPDWHRYSGDARTLIQSEGTAIVTYGTLTVNDARIIAPETYFIIVGDQLIGVGDGVGILMEFALSTTVADNTLVYGVGAADSLTLRNTQIGEPGGFSIIGYDPGTGLPIYGDHVGIAVDQNGTPRQVTSRILAGSEIGADGINGRIVAGQTVTMNRNPVGSVWHEEGWAPGTHGEAQATDYFGISGISGPSIGIHAQTHNDFYFLGPRTILVYGAGAFYINAGIPQGTHDAGVLYNTIDVLDNSWIFANTGIAFGSVGTSWTNSAIRITVDNTSGIYSRGTGALDPFATGPILSGAITGTGIFGTVTGIGTSAGYGITDRYSLVALWAYWGDPLADTPTAYRVDGGVGYSGSFHEIQIDGKLITGTPSRAGIALTFADLTGMSAADREKLSGVYYHDPSDIDADPRTGNIYYYVYDDRLTPNQNAERNERVAAKFVAYDTQPNRVFWIQIDGRDPEPLTQYDYAAQRWTVHPNASTVRINTGPYSSSTPLQFFTPFDQSFGVAIDIIGTSMAYEGVITPPTIDPWSTYYGPTVRQITALGNDALIAGGNAHNMMGAAISIGPLAHVANIIIGENNDVKNLSNVLFVGTSDTNTTPSAMTNFRQSVENYQAFDQMTAAKRARFLYDPSLLYTDELLDDVENYRSNRFHFDNAGVHGDIFTTYNAVTYSFGGAGTFAGAGWALTMAGTMHPFWMHAHPGAIPYTDEILEFGTSTGADLGSTTAWNTLVGIADDMNPSYLVGHRDYIGNGFGDAFGGGWTSAGIPGRSLVLDEVLLNFLANNRANLPDRIADAVVASFGYSYGYADSPQHFREALARFVHLDYTAATYAGLSVQEMLSGYTRDGTLVVFSNGDIFSSNIYGGGIGDNYRSRILGAGGGAYTNPVSNNGNIDLRFKDGTVIFNRNVLEIVDGAEIYRAPGIRVRDVYIEKTGHLLLNDAEFAVNPFAPLFVTPTYDYASRLIIHDVLNEGIVSGNGTFQIAQRWHYFNQPTNAGTTTAGVDYFAGYFINRGILAPGLPGFIGESERQARDIEQTAYDKMLNTVSDSSGDHLWRQLMRGVPGGQYGVINIFGSLRLMDEHTRPVYDPDHPLFNTDETLKPGEYHVTIGNDTIYDMFAKYASVIAQAIPTYDPATHTYNTSLLAEGEISQEDWKIIAIEKLGTHLSWFSASLMVDDKGLPVLTPYEQFEYMLDPARWTQQDHLLMRFGFSDVVSVHGTMPPYLYGRYGWGNPLYDIGSVPTSTIGTQLLGITQLGGVIQADRIYDTDPNAQSKENPTAFIIIASEGYTLNGLVQLVTSETTDWVFANVDTLPIRMASGQIPAVLTVIDDPNFYRNHVSKPGNSFNAKSVASTLDDAMFTNPGLASAFQFGLNDPAVLRDTLRQVANATRANSVVMNVWSPSDQLFNQVGYGTGGLSTGNRGNVTYRNMQTGQLQQPYGRPAVPPPGHQFAPHGAQTRGQSPFFRTGSIWGAYTHSNFSMGDDDNSFKYSYYRNGVMIGNEWNLTPSSVLGGVFTVNDGQLRSLDDRVKSVDYTFGLYFVAAPFEQFELKSYFGGGYQTYKTDRYIRNGAIFIGNNIIGGSYNPDSIFGINDNYSAETRGHSFNYAIEFARPFTMSPNFVIRPVAGFEYQSIQQNAYSDKKGIGEQVSWSNNGRNVAEGNFAEGATSGTFGMNYKSMTFSRSFLRLGFNTESYFARGGWQFRTYYVGRLTGDRFPVSEQSFTSGSRTFNVRGAELGSYCQVGTGLNFWLNQDKTASIFMNGDWNFSLGGGGYSMLNANIGLLQNF